jgi:hypothetical protein
VHYKDTVKHTDNKGIHKQTQQEATLSSSLEEATLPPEAVREQHAPSQESPQQRKQPSPTTDHCQPWPDKMARSTRANHGREIPPRADHAPARKNGKAIGWIWPVQKTTVITARKRVSWKNRKRNVDLESWKRKLLRLKPELHRRHKNGGRTPKPTLKTRSLPVRTQGKEKTTKPKQQLHYP